MLTWLSQRLDMPYVSGPTMPLWGNAILSKYPIISYANYDLQPRTLNLLRGFTRATIDIGGNQRLDVITTHLHQINEDSAIRLEQVENIIQVWNQAPRTVFLGDLNADPEDPEMEFLRQAGFIDCAAFLSASPATTTVDQRRLDYIWISPDLKVTELSVPFTPASDHLPVIASISSR
jgi:endonuclease/exonuclease/phosphatase family metal-dependent hydrolase